jgi:glycosyltransferase involved in cell wall biosynthesis
MSECKLKIGIITNIPAPYRNLVYSELSKLYQVELFVIFCTHTEPNRHWEAQLLDFKHKFLSRKTEKFIHLNWNVLSELNRFNPDVVITAGFNPTMLFAWIWALTNKKKHIPISDANIHSESKLSILHRLIRKMVFKSSAAFIGASEKTLELYKSYGIEETLLFKSCLAVENEKFSPVKVVDKPYDLLFCGQFNERKNPLFFAKMAGNVNEINPGIKVLLVGEGPLKEKTKKELKKYNVMYFDAGFVQSGQIIGYYHSSKIFIFPTLKDPWGLVANEALASGMPVLVSSVAGVANELVIDEYNGFVFDDFDLNKWVEKTQRLLVDQTLYKKFSENALRSVGEYTHSEAATGIFQAAKFANL